jgi:hypothetical protein
VPPARGVSAEGFSITFNEPEWMSGSVPPPGAPTYAPPPGPTSPPPPAWAPMGSPWLPAARHDIIGLVSFICRAGGYLLLFIGTLIAVIAVSVPGGCYTTPTPSYCGATFASSAASWFIAAKILAALGLAGLGFGSALKMHYSLRMPQTGHAEEVAFVTQERRVHGIVFVVSVVLLFVLIVVANLGVVVPP